jgi:hypothetical protein
METVNRSNECKMRMINRRFVVGGFLALHGAMNALLLATPTVDGSAGNYLTNGGRSWILNPLGISGLNAESFGAFLAISAALCFMLGAAAYLGYTGLQPRPLLLVAAICSLTTLFLFWNEWDIVGALINVVVIALCLVRHGAFFEVA